MTTPKHHLSTFRVSEKNTQKNYLVRDILPMLVEQGQYQDLWRSPGFQHAYHLSSFLEQSAGLLRKHLPPRYHEQIRFTQNPDTWILGVFDASVASELGKILKSHYGSIMRDGSGLPQHVKLRRVYRNWEQFGMFLSTIELHHAKHIERLRSIIPETLQGSVRLRYEPSVWQLNVKNSAVATQLQVLLAKLEGEMEALKMQKASISQEIQAKNKQVTKVKNEIKKLNKKSENIIVSEPNILK